ncbi:MAG: aldo/keto reductase [Alphaproteobacteria bacterium]|nr:aldo/keto reductase [Alphaproteobacteria bacterium]
MIKSSLHPTRLTLGTAQLGLRYGIANRAGRPDDATAAALLDRAWDLGIRSFDTARAYGDAEARLGGWLGDGHHEAMVISKLPRLAGEAVVQIFEQSEAALGQNRLTAYLVHDVDDLADPAVADALRALVETGRIAAFGASVYTAEQAMRALDVEGLAAIQLPLSLFNLRMVISGVLGACAEAGVVVFARSVFVQGLIFLDPAALPGHLTAARGVLGEFHALCAAAGSDPLTLALATVLARAEVGSVVVGAETPGQIEEIAAAAARTVDPDLIERARDLAAGAPAELFDPSTWPEN